MPTDFVGTENPTAAAVLVEVNLRVVNAWGLKLYDIPWIIPESPVRKWAYDYELQVEGPWRQGGPAATESKSNATCVRLDWNRGGLPTPSGNATYMHLQ